MVCGQAKPNKTKNVHMEKSRCYQRGNREKGKLGKGLTVWEIPGGDHDNSFQYSYLEKPMDRGAWQAIVQRVAKS